MWGDAYKVDVYDETLANMTGYGEGANFFTT